MQKTNVGFLRVVCWVNCARFPLSAGQVGLNLFATRERVGRRITFTVGFMRSGMLLAGGAILDTCEPGRNFRVKSQDGRRVADPQGS